MLSYWFWWYWNDIWCDIVWLDMNWNLKRPWAIITLRYHNLGAFCPYSVVISNKSKLYYIPAPYLVEQFNNTPWQQQHFHLQNVHWIGKWLMFIFITSFFQCLLCFIKYHITNKIQITKIHIQWKRIMYITTYHYKIAFFWLKNEINFHLFNSVRKGRKCIHLS